MFAIIAKYVVSALAGYGIKAFFVREESKLAAEAKKIRVALGVKRALLESEITKLASLFKKL